MAHPEITCIITEDEPLARKGLLGYAERTGFLRVTGQCENALQLNALLKQQPADLLFLDIEMPYLSGIEFLKSFPNPPRVIFTTAFEQYALQGFELDVLDYLVKPVSFERFLKAANKAYEFFLGQRSAPQADYLFIRADNKLEKVLFADILYAESLENYVAIHTARRKMITHATLKSLQESLPPGLFVQTHKSYVVNTGQVTAIEGNTLHIGSHRVPVSKYLRDQVLEKIVNNRLLKK
ncbi:MAG TPA: LytTR family DNA-binding domain-containing protein [Chitinophagaceae bacterium]|nr:LytTR family DNA-binding domain-containing protein [Chitinophagaceae bacterium]